MRNLALFLIMAFVLLFAAWSRADQDHCRKAMAMVSELHDAEADLADMKALASQLCSERALRKECARQRIEIRAYEAELLALQRETLTELRACNASKATRKASAP